MAYLAIPKWAGAVTNVYSHQQKPVHVSAHINPCAHACILAYTQSDDTSTCSYLRNLAHVCMCTHSYHYQPETSRKALYGALKGALKGTLRGNPERSP